MGDCVGKRLSEGIQGQLLDSFPGRRSYFFECIGPFSNICRSVELVEHRTSVYVHSFENLRRASAKPHDVDSGERVRIRKEGSCIHELAICICEAERSQGVPVELIDSEPRVQTLLEGSELHILAVCRKLIERHVIAGEYEPFQFQ